MPNSDLDRDLQVPMTCFTVTTPLHSDLGGTIYFLLLHSSFIQVEPEAVIED